MVLAVLRRLSAAQSPSVVAQEYLPLESNEPLEEGEAAQGRARNPPISSQSLPLKTSTKILAFLLALAAFVGLWRWSFRFPPPDHDWMHDEPPWVEHPSESKDPLWSDRANEVVREFLHAYHSYERYAFPHDELQPLSKTPIDNFNGWGVSVVDSIDTMKLMGLESEYARAVKHVAALDLKHSKKMLPFFETTIRYLGGFLSAYAASGDPIFATKADEMGQRLLPAFNTPLGLPVFSLNASSGELGPREKFETVLVEIGTFQLEFQYLAHITGRAEYFEAANRMTQLMADTQDLKSGMWGSFWKTDTAKQVDAHLTVGGVADSAYEYVIKSYLQGSQTDPRLRKVVIRMINGIIDNLLYLSPTRHLLYVTDIPTGSGGQPSNKQEHLSCFAPGMIALSAKYLALGPDFDKKTYQKWMGAAKGLAKTCWITYADNESGLGPDEVSFDAWPGDPRDGLWVKQVRLWEASGAVGGEPPGVDTAIPLRGAAGNRDYMMRLNAYQLRPETVESLFVLYKVTGDSVWRDRAWEIFVAIRKYCRMETGYASVVGVNQGKPHASDAMPSWFLAETLKYLYLIASPRDLVPLDEWVFNTEAHPLPVIHWRDWEKEKYFGVALGRPRPTPRMFELPTRLRRSPLSIPGCIWEFCHFRLVPLRALKAARQGPTVRADVAEASAHKVAFLLKRQP